MVGIGSISDRDGQGLAKSVGIHSGVVLWFGLVSYEQAGDETASTCVYESFYFCIYSTFFYSILTP